MTGTSQTISNPPDAKSLMMTARSFGNYDLAAALADLIDNSIKAKSKEIKISCTYAHDNGYCEVRIRDDGHGMTESELIQAMRPASADPSQQRPVDDLGRFGWGMKSASFSQAKILTIVSSKNGSCFGARWDLDNIDGWRMDVFSDKESKTILSQPFGQESGTELVWNNCDRLTENNSLSQTDFNSLIKIAREKLSLIFHRYLSGEVKKTKLKISINGLPLDEIDPFCTNNVATQVFADDEDIELQGSSGKSIIKVKGYVLPHYSKLTQHEYEHYGGKEGYTKNQGFYVYRNKRLIMWGTWFLLAKHGELSKLVRIRVDIPNTLDDIWKITVDKSDAQLPAVLKKRMEDIIEQYRVSSTNVFKKRGARIDKNRKGNVWERLVKNGEVRFRINRSHPVLLSSQRDLNKEQRKLIKNILNLIETQLPLESITFEVEKNPQSVCQEHTSREELAEFIEATLPTLMSKFKSSEELIKALKLVEPYASNWEVTGDILRKMRLL